MNVLNSGSIGDFYPCDKCGLYVQGTHICTQGTVTYSWPQTADPRLIELLERIADSLEKIAKQKKKSK